MVTAVLYWHRVCREINGLEHTFGVSGKLIMNALVMYDQQTGTLWSQFLGQAVRGDLLGESLEPIPLTMTTWERWVEEHPDTLALDKINGFYTSDSYESYYRNNLAAGVIGQSNSYNRLSNKDLVLGVGFDEGAKAYPFEVLARDRVVNDEILGEPSVVCFDNTADTAFAFISTVNDQELTFDLAREDERDFLIDRETGSKWIAFTGTAFEGPLEGLNLEQVHSTVSFWFAWTDFIRLRTCFWGSSRHIYA